MSNMGKQSLNDLAEAVANDVSRVRSSPIQSGRPTLVKLDPEVMGVIRLARFVLIFQVVVIVLVLLGLLLGGGLAVFGHKP